MPESGYITERTLLSGRETDERPGRMDCHEILRTWFMAELAHAREQGIAVDVEGVPYEDQTPDEVWELMQKRNYMLDYEGDDTGRIVALHIELLKPLKNPEKMRYKFTNGR